MSPYPEEFAILEKFAFERKPVGVKFTNARPAGLQKPAHPLDFCEMLVEALKRLLAAFQGTNFLDHAVALGRGDGTFSPYVTYLVGGYPAHVAIADVNGDGNPDAVVTHVFDFQPGLLGVLLGDGAGSFAPETTSTGDQLTGTLAVGDVTGDGIADAVVGGDVSAFLMRGNGDGSFAAPVALATAPPPEALVPPFPPGAAPIPSPPCVAVAIADLDGDGKLDVVAANSSSLSTTTTFLPTTCMRFTSA